jgi:predicted ABC-type ATPase
MVAIEAGKIMINRINELIKQKKDFAFETTLAPESHVNTINFAKENGYNITLVFFWLNSFELAIERVKMRVNEGGHNIPTDTIKRRYINGLQNLTNLYIEISDYWLIINNSIKPGKIIAEGINNNVVTVYDNEIWNTIINKNNG